ncbi:DUF3048 domain-containing protein [Lysinibacter cavernae]|uniref:DUF3048 domain-containing protein n=1 Tax=Lysinibacter cavernae TaxID=1640652 RepID=A0A7X5R147_9MICO|nr:DUF3048 domain-containing protein [Lysinibacter cavernae]NIH53774.1 hypothetical protein [Lysinibacter cavernae]
MRTSNRLLRLAVVGAAAAVFAAGCAPATPKDAPEATGEYASSYTVPAERVLAPLRGTAVEVAPENPSLAVKIDNHEEARPHYGLNSTDLVFEELVEGGLTRYVAVFQSSVPETVGPVRSIRPMDPDIISPMGGLVAYSGGADQFVAKMRDAPVVNILDDAGDPYFDRGVDRIAPHNLLLRAQEAVAAHADIPAPQQQFAYSIDQGTSSAARLGAPVNSLSLTFSPERFPSWSWNAEAGVYLRSQEGSADVGMDGAQHQSTNVVVLKVPVERGDVPFTQLTGTGEAWFSSAGKTVQGSWAKGTRDEPLRFVDASGFTVQLAPGNTWIEMIPADEGTIVTE